MQICLELYQPNVHVCVRLPLVSTKVSFANTIQNVLTLVAATLMLQVMLLVEDVEYDLEPLPNMFACGVMKTDGSMLLCYAARNLK